MQKIKNRLRSVLKQTTIWLLLFCVLFLLGGCMIEESSVTSTRGVENTTASATSTPLITVSPEITSPSAGSSLLTATPLITPGATVTQSEKPQITASPSQAPTSTPTPVPTPTRPAGQELSQEEICLQSMSLEQKIAQMMLVSYYGNDVAVMKRAAAYGVGGLCLYAPAFKDKNKTQVRAMTQSLQDKAAVLLLISVDEEGGTVNRVSRYEALRKEPFLSPSALYAQGGWEKVKSDTLEKAELLLDLGINVNLAPVCDVPLSKNDYIYPRCFSMDAVETEKYIAMVTEIMKQQKLGSALKHFPGYGGSNDTHKGMAYDKRPYSDFVNADFLPFIAGIEAGADSVLVSHNIVTSMDADYLASLSVNVHRILRQELGFDGVIITDDLSMKAISQYTDGKNPAVQAVLAGNDLLCYSDYQTAVKSILAAVQEGIITEKRIDESVLRILRWKLNLGLQLPQG